MVPKESTFNHTSHSRARSATGRSANLQRTPFTNPRVSLHQVKKDGKNTGSLKILKILLRQQWSAYSVSPLFTWSSRESKLKRYSRRMATHLAETLPSEAGDSFQVEYKIDGSLKLGVNDDAALEITVNVCREDDLRQVFCGYLLSWGCPKRAKSRELDGVLYLPVLICSGSKRVGNQVRRALATIHDCMVSSLELRESDRKELWMALLSYLQNEAETLTIRYIIPNRQSVGPIDLNLPTELTTKLSKLIHKKHGRDVTYEEIALFWNEINDFVHDIYRINIQHCEMTRLTLREAVLSADKFRATTAKAMHVILIFLTNMSVQLDSVTDVVKRR